MALAHVAALIRAVSRLRGPGTLDPQLVDALATLLLPRPEAIKPEPTRLPPGSSLTAPRSVSPKSAEISDGPPLPAPVPSAAAPLAGGVKPKPRAAAGDAQKLVALASSWVQTAERADLAAPRRLAGGTKAANAPVTNEAPGPAAPQESLFPATRVRAILRDMATSSKPTGQPDLAAAVRLIAQAQPIKELPQGTKTTLGHNIVLLFDAGPAMLPFARDKQQLAATALRLLGKDRVRVNDFLVDPMRGVRAQRQVRWEPLRWPGRGSTLLLISDLGIGDNQPARELQGALGQSFIDECHRRGLRSVVLIPYQRERWPTLAARFDVALTWDLDAGVQALRRSMRQLR